MGWLPALLLLASAPAHAGETQVYLSWGSPYGFPGARDTLERACGDSTRVDTLSLSFEAGEDFPSLVAITGDVEFRPPRGDTLGGYWTFRNDAKGPGSCHGEFAGSARVGCPFPWSSAGMPAAGFLRRDGYGLLRFIYAVSVKSPTSVIAGKRYCLARILIQHHGDPRGGCDQPLSVVWSEAAFSSYPGGERRILSGRQRPLVLRGR